MPAVSNTSPVLNLGIVGQLALLREQFGQVLIPDAVLGELRIGEDLPGSQSIREALELGWIRVESVKESTLVHVLRFGLHAGEAEAIVLALEMKVERILLDEREARQVAKSLGLATTGVLGVLLRARQEGKLVSLTNAMDELRLRAGFHIGPQLYSELAKASGENQ